jgi:hypothetical protein
VAFDRLPSQVCGRAFLIASRYNVRLSSLIRQRPFFNQLSCQAVHQLP